MSEYPIPNPGSHEAQAVGCKCPVIDNGRGAGAWISPQGEPEFWISEDCPVHWGREQVVDDDEG